MNPKNAFLFPAFCHELKIEEWNFLEKNQQAMNPDFALNQIGLDLKSFFNQKNRTNDQVELQILTYIYSCLLAKIITKHQFYPQLIAGYSMGLYAALHFSQAIDYATGLELIKKAYHFIFQSIKSETHAIGSVIGLEIADLNKIIRENSTEVEIINHNNRLSFVVAGKMEAIKLILNRAGDEGALKSSLLPITCPYHTSQVDQAAALMQVYLEKIRINPPQIPIISAVNQKVLTTVFDVKNEIQANINHHLNWHKTMDKMVKSGYNLFFECGLGKNLFKIGRFIQGNFKIITNDKLEKLFNRREQA